MKILTSLAYATFFLPLLASIFVGRTVDVRNARSLAAAVAGLVFLVACVAFVGHQLSGASQGPAFAFTVGTYAVHFGLDGLSLAFFPAVSVVTFAVLLATPHHDIDSSSLAWALVGLAGSALVGLTFDPWVMVIGFALSFAPALVESRRRAQRLVFRWIALVALISTTAVAVTAVIVVTHPDGFAASPWLAEVAAGAIVVAMMSRLGVFPLHSWIPLTAERTSLPIASTTLAAPLVALVYVRLGVANLGDTLQDLSPALVVLGAFSAVYGLLGALGRHRLRRAMGFLTVSMNGIIFSALASHSEASITGAILHATSGTMAIAGLLAVSHAVLARAGTDDARQLGGIVSRSPVIATSFLMLALAFVGFPGTVGFASEDLLLQGIMRGHRLVTGVILAVTAVNGITLYRFYVKVFLGPSHRRAVASFTDLLPRERLAVIVLLVLLVGGGFVPAPLVDIHHGVVQETHGRGLDRDREDDEVGDIASLRGEPPVSRRDVSRTSESASR